VLGPIVSPLGGDGVKKKLGVRGDGIPSVEVHDDWTRGWKYGIFFKLISVYLWNKVYIYQLRL
jgi:hypothetical protein